MYEFEPCNSTSSQISESTFRLMSQIDTKEENNVGQNDQPEELVIFFKFNLI